MREVITCIAMAKCFVSSLETWSNTIERRARGHASSWQNVSSQVSRHVSPNERDIISDDDKISRATRHGEGKTYYSYKVIKINNDFFNLSFISVFYCIFSIRGPVLIILTSSTPISRGVRRPQVSDCRVWCAAIGCWLSCFVWRILSIESTRHTLAYDNSSGVCRFV